MSGSPSHRAPFEPRPLQAGSDPGSSGQWPDEPREPRRECDNRRREKRRRSAGDTRRTGCGRWSRRATIAMTTLAALELVALAGASVALLGNPLARHLKASAATAAAPRIRAAAPVSAARATLTRSQTSVLVLNGNGRTGAAAAAADRVTARGYLV